jgi:transcriptional regulator with XRE-family HTH domain
MRTSAHDALVTNRRDPAANALWIARQIRTTVGTDIREGRMNAGLSQQSAGSAVGMSHAQFGRIERGALATPTIEQLSLACAAVGLKLVVRAYPDGDAVRDAAQLGLLRRLRAVLPAQTTWQSEVPLPIRGDRRAWDAVIRFAAREVVAVEAETRFRDAQSVQRRVALKKRDGGIDHVILLISDTNANRHALAAVRQDLRSQFPLDSRAVLAAIRAGHAPESDGIVLL